MATINLDGDETILYGPGFQTTVLSPGLGTTARPIAVVTDPEDGDTLVYRDGAFQNESLNDFVQDSFVNVTGDTMTGALVVDHTLTVNESGADRDTRIEGDTDPNLLFVDASTDRVGIGTNTPAALLDVDGTARVTTLNIGGTDVTSSAAELNALDGITASVTELNYTDGVTSAIQTQLDGKVSDTGDTMTGQLAMNLTTDPFNIKRFNTSGFGPFILLHTSRAAASPNHTVVANNDDVGGIIVKASDGTNYIGLAEIRFDIDGTPGTNDMPGRIEFHTTPDGSATSVERVRIPSTGGIAIQDGITAPATISGMAVIYVDTADGDLKVKFGDGTVKTIVADS